MKEAIIIDIVAPSGSYLCSTIEGNKAKYSALSFQLA